MSRTIAALAIAAALIIGAFIIKDRVSAPENSTALVAEQIQNANQASLEAYDAELQASGVASDTALVVPQSVLDDLATSSAPLPPPTATDKLAQNIFESYVSAKQSGVDITSDVATQIANSVLSQSYTDSSSSKMYSLSDLNIKTVASKQDMKNYGNAVGTALSIPLPADGEFELQIFSAFAVSNDETTLSKLTENIDRYRKIISSLLAMPAPKTFTQAHLALVDAFSKVLYDVETMQNFPADPLGAQNAAQEYQTSFQAVTSALATEKTLFLSNGISFSATDPGYFLIK